MPICNRYVETHAIVNERNSEALTKNHKEYSLNLKCLVLGQNDRDVAPCGHSCEQSLSFPMRFARLN
jgi:hypothetical protein